MKRRQLECRVVITHQPDHTFSLGMFDPIACRYESLGTHLKLKIEPVVRGLRERMEREGHRVTFSEVTAPR